MIEETINKLGQKVSELNRGIDPTWFFPKKAPANPARAAIRKDWPKWDGRQPVRKNEWNWFFAELVFPAEQAGVALAGTDALLSVIGYAPFTLWIDGVEMFREDRAWMATGPIFEPFPVRIEPGRRHRLVLALRPTVVPPGFPAGPCLQVRFRECLDRSLDLEAAQAQLRLARALAETGAEKRLVERAAAAIHLEGFDGSNPDAWPRVLASIAEMERILLPLSPPAKEHVVHVTGHSHIDMDWTWTWEDTVHIVRRDFKAVTDLMDEFPDLTFTHSQVPTYEIARRLDPKIFAKIKQRIAEGRWENAAATWVENDLNMADGEAIARQMLYAGDWTRKHLGSKARVFWAPDTFGHPGNMPQLAKLGEHDCYYHLRCNPGREDNWLIREWEGVDGTKIVAFSSCYIANLDPNAIVNEALQAGRFGIKNSLHVWGMGDHGGAVYRFQIERLARFRDKPLIPTIRFSTVCQTLEAIRREGTRLPTNKGETYSLFEGCFTTHAANKKENRRCEGALLTAETLAALAGIDRTSQLRKAWEKVLFNQFHDTLDGSAAHDTYLPATRRAAAALRTARKVASEAAARLVEPSPNGDELVLVNQLGFERTEPVRVKLPKDTKCLLDDRGRVVPVQRLGGEFVFVADGLPALGTKHYAIPDRQPEAARPETVSISDGTGIYSEFLEVETDHAIARVSKSSGVIGSYYDKRLGREFVAYGVPKWMTHVLTTRKDLALNVFQLIDESPNGMSSWIIHDPIREESLLKGAEVEVVERGPVFGLIRVKHTFRSSKIVEEIVFYKAFPRVDFQLRIDWREKGDERVGVPQLKLSFATGMSAARARFEGPFFIAERPADGQEQPTQKWVDLAGDEFGFALLNDSKYGCDALGGRLRMTLLRNAYGPDPETDNGVHTIALAFVPHGPVVSAAELVRAGMAFNRPPVALRGRCRRSLDGALRLAGSAAVVCTCFRRAEHSPRLLVRLFETSGKRAAARLSLGKRIRSAEEVNFLENPTGGKVKLDKGTATLRFHPYEVKTLLVESDLRGLAGSRSE